MVERLPVHQRKKPVSLADLSAGGADQHEQPALPDGADRLGKEGARPVRADGHDRYHRIADSVRISLCAEVFRQGRHDRLHQGIGSDRRMALGIKNRKKRRIPMKKMLTFLLALVMVLNAMS